MKTIITISREFGAAGAEIGQKVAERLGYYYCDKDMVIHSAMADGTISKEELKMYDEKLHLGFGQRLFDFYNKPLNERLFEAQRKALMKIGAKGKCVIVGRNANVVLKEFDRSLHVFISASPYFRLQNLKKKMPGVSEDKILEEMKNVDKARRRYCTYYTNTEFGNADYYDLMLKSSSIGIDECVDIICRIAEADK